MKVAEVTNDDAFAREMEDAIVRSFRETTVRQSGDAVESWCRGELTLIGCGFAASRLSSLTYRANDSATHCRAL